MKKILASLNIGKRIILGFSLLILLFLFVMITVEVAGIPGTTVKGKFTAARDKNLGDLELASGLLGERLASWIAERRIDIDGLTLSPMLRNAIENSKSQPKSEIMGELQAFLKSHPDIDSITILDPVNVSLVAVSGSSANVRSLADLAITPEKLSRLVIPGYQETIEFIQGNDNRTHLRIVRQMISTDASQRVIALMIAESNLEEALRPLIWSVRNSIVSHDWECIIASTVGTSLSQFQVGKSGIKPLSTPITNISKSDPITLALSGINAPYEGLDQFGKNVLAFHRQIAVDRSTSLGLVLKVESSLAYKQAKEDLTREVILWLALFGAGFILCVFLARQIVSPVKELAAVARKIEDGDFTARSAETDQTEIGQLAMVFNSMASKIENSHMELEKQVADRTQELQVLSERQNALLTAVPDIIMEVDVNRVYTWANGAGLEFFGDDVIGKEAAYYFVGEQDTYQKTKPLFEGTSGVLYVESWQRRKDGEVRLLAWWCKVLVDGQGLVTGTLSTARDITEQKLSEVALIESERRTTEALEFNSSILKTSSIGILTYHADGKCIFANQAAAVIARTDVESLLAQNFHEIQSWKVTGMYETALRSLSSDVEQTLEAHVITTFGNDVWLSISFSSVTVKGEKHLLVFTQDITRRKTSEEALQKRLIALTKPLESGSVAFDEMFNVDDLQRLQDQFARATGVASIITYPDGTPLTAPSNFTSLCSDIIRKTEKGCANCFKSDAALGRYNPDGPNIQTCLSGGLWDAGAGITVGGQHIANWLIGQVRDETQTEEMMAAYAREIGVEETSFLKAFREIPPMSFAQFEQIAQALFTLANQLSTSAYQNVQQARFINERKLAEEALRKSEETFRMIFNNAAIGLMLADGQCVAIDCNQHFAEIFGASRQDYIGMNLLATIPEGPVRQHLLNTLADNLVHRYEGPYTSQVTDKELYLSITSQRVSTDHVIIIINDITERREAEKELQTTRFMVEHASDALFWITPDARIVDANEAACRSLGYSKAELLQLSVPDVDVNYNADTWPDHFAELRRCRSLKFESVQRTKDGRSSPVEIVANYIQFDDREFNCAFVRDISERKKSEEQLASLTQRLQLATSSAHLGIWDWNVRENTMVWDDRMFELYGIARASFPDSIDAWMSGLHPEDRETAIAEHQAALNGEKEFDTEFRVLYPDGTVKYIRGKGLVLRGEDGNPERMLGINYDVTDSRHAEEERHKLESQLQQAQKMESVGRLAGGVAHDFNNMLGVILGHAELGLMQLEPTNPVCADLKEISKTAERSADLTRQLLAFARKQTVSPKTIDLNDTITNTLKMLQRLIGEDIHLVWHPSPDQCQVKMDPSQIDQILANLCVNARDAIEDTGRITIETGTCFIDADYCAANPEAAPGDYVRLVVSDSGKGMDRETLTHIFEPFYTTKELGKGTGLGLATVYGAVKQNNGFINIYSEPGNGTTFSIHLPRYAGDTFRTQEELGSQTVLRGQETILLVEDEAAILNITAIMLEKQGYTVLRGDSPGRAMELAREYHGPIHLLMTDVIMPEMNGRDLARNILTIHPGMKRLFMSGYTADVIAHHGVLDDGVHFIQKPFSLPSMAAKVREVLDSN